MKRTRPGCQLMTMEGENLFIAFWHSAIPLQFFGTSPISLQRSNKITGYHVSVIGVVYISILIGLFAYFGYVAVWEATESTFEPGQLVMLLIHIWTRIVLNPICTVLLLMTSITKSSTACRVISGFAEFSTALPQYFSPFFYRFMFFGSSALFVIFLTLAVIQSYVEYENVVVISNGNLPSLYFWSFYVSWVGFDIVTWAIITQLLIYSGMLYYQFRALDIEVAGDLRKANIWKSFRNSMKVVTNKNGFMPSCPKNLKNLRQLHNHLTGVAADLNQVFASQILVFIACNTVLLCFSLFILLLNLDGQEDAPPFHVSFLWFCIRIFPIYLAIYPFSRIKNKVGDLSATIHVWITKIEDQEVLKELHYFANQVDRRKLKFSAHGFFRLENSTIISIIGSAISYLVVLVQFHSLFKRWYLNTPFLIGSSTANVSFPDNATQVVNE